METIDMGKMSDIRAIKALEKEPCTDAISRQDAIDTFYEYPNVSWTTLDILEKINSLSPVNPTEKVGHWINPTTMQCMKEQVFYYCSVCGNYADANKYCPTCGAKMQEVEE